MKKIFFVLLLPFLAAFVLAGCGYSSKSLLPDNIKTIHIQNFTNGIDPTREISDRRNSYSYRPGLESEITRAVIDAFIKDRHIEVTREDGADITLSGKLVDCRQYPLSYQGRDSIEEFRMEIYVDVEVYDNNAKQMLWKEKNFMGQSSYIVAGSNRKTLGQAQRSTVQDMADRIVERTVEKW
ncbi:MAG: hypothetical protein HQL30_07950 [Candidatus Omnitrophica bacterium]|nr:hypothetical protein [Candidatus Omnitrophota bacterium]